MNIEKDLGGRYFFGHAWGIGLVLILILASAFLFFSHDSRDYFCSEISDEKERMECLSSTAKNVESLGSLDACDNFPDESLLELCLNIEPENGYCYFYSPISLPDACVLAYAIFEGDISYCYDLLNISRDMCILSYLDDVDDALADNDISICLDIVKEEYRDMCVDTFGYDNRYRYNLSACDFMSEGERASCVQGKKSAKNNNHLETLSSEKVVLDCFDDSNKDEGLVEGLRQRESIIVRTNENGTYDSLWFDWEEEYFGCSKCANRFGDNDNDNMHNLFEFFLGSDPNSDDSNGNGISDFDMVKACKNPITGEIYPGDFKVFMEGLASEAEFYKNSGGLYPLRKDQVKHRSVVMRTEYKILMEGKMSELRFNYSWIAVEEEKDYATVFIGDKLVDLIEVVTGDNGEYHDVVVPLDGSEIGEVIFVLNSYGKKGSLFGAKDISFS